MITCNTCHLTCAGSHPVILCSFMIFPGSETQWVSLPCWPWDPPKAALMGLPFCPSLCLWCGSARANQSTLCLVVTSKLSSALRFEREWLTPWSALLLWFHDWFRMAGPLLPTPILKWIPSPARGWKESDLVISSSGNSPWQQFKAA